MTRQQIVAKTPMDLAYLAPSLIGFHPVESLVLLTFGGPGFHARVDLAPSEQANEPCHAMGNALEVNKTETTKVAVMVFSDDSDLAAAHIAGMMDVCDALAVPLIDATWINGTEVRSGLDGHLIGTVDWDHSPFATKIMGPRSSREELAALLEPDGETETMLRLVKANLAGVLMADRPMLVDHTRWLLEITDSTVGEPLLDEDVARLVACMESVDLRDVVWSAITMGNGPVMADLLIDVVRRTPMEYRAPVCSLLAFAQWMKGDGASAWIAVDKAQEVDADYTMAVLIAMTLNSGTSPNGWTPPESDLVNEARR